eukprot:271191-Pelagomonas_calceolata.AAC.2
MSPFWSWQANRQEVMKKRADTVNSLMGRNWKKGNMSLEFRTCTAKKSQKYDPRSCCSSQFCNALFHTWQGC